MYGRELATSFVVEKTGELYSPDFVMLARSLGVDAERVTRAVDLEGVIETAIAANKPYLVEVSVQRDVSPAGTGTWEQPPLPHPQPNFRSLAGLEGNGR
jgi:acetolactate synthase-1/2/3 large subunit